VDPIGTFTRTHPTRGTKQTREAYSPAEAVQLRADGWAEKTTKSSSSSSSSSSGGSSSKSSS